MTKFANVSFEVEDAQAPEGIVVGGFSVSLMSLGNLVQNQVVAEAGPVVFSIDAAGDYTVQVCRVAESGEAISTSAESAVFTVSPEIVMMGVPVTVTVTLSDAMEVPTGVEVAVN